MQADLETKMIRSSASGMYQASTDMQMTIWKRANTHPFDLISLQGQPISLPSSQVFKNLTRAISNDVSHLIILCKCAQKCIFNDEWCGAGLHVAHTHSITAPDARQQGSDHQTHQREANHSPFTQEKTWNDTSSDGSVERWDVWTGSDRRCPWHWVNILQRHSQRMQNAWWMSNPSDAQRNMSE